MHEILYRLPLNKSYVPVKSKLQRPPGQPPSGYLISSNAPPINTETPLLKEKFRLQSNTVHASQREICRYDTFKLLLKTLLKELFANKGKILSCKSVKPRKN